MKFQLKIIKRILIAISLLFLGGTAFAQDDDDGGDGGSDVYECSGICDPTNAGLAGSVATGGGGGGIPPDGGVGGGNDGGVSSGTGTPDSGACWDFNNCESGSLGGG